MDKGTVLVNIDTGEESTVTILGHWSTIVSSRGIQDRVKWLGGASKDAEYISQFDDNTYKIKGE